MQRTLWLLAIALMVVTVGCIGATGSAEQSSVDSTQANVTAVNQTDQTNQSAENVTRFTKTVELAFHQARGPEPVGPRVFRGANCAFLVDGGPDLTVVEGTVSAEWTTTVGPSTLLLVAQGWKEPPIDTTLGDGQAEVGLSDWHIGQQGRGLNAMFKLWVPEGDAARIGVQATVTMDLVLAGELGEVTRGTCT